MKILNGKPPKGFFFRARYKRIWWVDRTFLIFLIALSIQKTSNIVGTKRTYLFQNHALVP